MPSPTDMNNPLQPRRGNRLDWEAGAPAPAAPVPAPPPAAAPEIVGYRTPASDAFTLSPTAKERYSEFLTDLQNDQESMGFMQALLAAIPFLKLLLGGPTPDTAIEVATTEWDLIAQSAAGLPNVLRNKYRDRCLFESISTTLGYTAADKRFWKNFCEIFDQRPAPVAVPAPPAPAPSPPPAPSPREQMGDPTGAGKGPRPGGNRPSPAQPPATPVAPAPAQPPSPPAPPAPGHNLGRLG
jgi:hypothetical protein